MKEFCEVNSSTLMMWNTKYQLDMYQVIEILWLYMQAVHTFLLASYASPLAEK